MPLPKPRETDLSSRVSTIEAQLSGLATSLEQHATHTEAAIQAQGNALRAHAEDAAEMIRDMAATSNAATRELNDSLRKIASETNASIQAISLRQEQARRTPWGVLASWAAVVIAVGGVFGSIYMNRVAGIEARVDAQAAKTLSDAYSDGQRDAGQRILEREIDRLRSGGKTQ